jgi:hypothetical protein
VNLLILVVGMIANVRMNFKRKSFRSPKVSAQIHPKRAQILIPDGGDLMPQ